MLFTSTKPHYEYLRKKWLAKNKAAGEKFLGKHGSTLRHLTIGGLGGLMLLNTPGNTWALPVSNPENHERIAKGEDKNRILAEALKGLVPEEVRKLDEEEEARISKIISENLGLDVKPELMGIRLNRSYGFIGGEQHLYRFPGDNLYKHFNNATDWAMYGPAGIAPGLGAWGYFAPSEAQFRDADRERERYYLAVQTFLSPGFSENVAKFRDFFRFRKMVVVNPKTGQTVAAVVGDAGPAEWTGKHLGGSPEVMQFLGLAEGPRKGAVLYFFINDPDEEISLGPITPREGGL